MSHASQSDVSTQQHLWMCLLGALAGLSMWVLFDYLPDALDNQRLLIWIASATVGFFVLLFALLGSLRWRDAVTGAGVLALSDAALLYWASGRFIEAEDLFDGSFLPLAWAIILFVGAPFAAAAMQGKLRDYAFLFDTAWNIVVRYLAAWIFVGLVWGLVFLSDALLGIVGVTIIETLLDYDPVPPVLTGASVGIALSVAQDLKAYVSPYLPLRLLRLLLPLVLGVVAVFIVALPFQGLSDLFGDFSAAAVLMGVAIAAISLITSALDRQDDDGIQSRGMVWMTRALALLLPVLAGLAVWAMWLRVAEYSWTPERLAASLAALLILAYAVLYGLAALQPSVWRLMIRQTNIAMAALVLVLSALWMTPLMNAHRMSAEAQLGRYLTGDLAAKDLPAWEIRHDWGRAGLKVIEQLKSLDAVEHAEVLARLERAETQSRWEFKQNDQTPDANRLATDLRKHIQIWPEGRSLPEAYFDDISHHHLEHWSEVCTLNAARPCAMVFGPFETQGIETAILFLPDPDQGAEAVQMRGKPDKPSYFSDLRPSKETSLIAETDYQKVLSGGYRIGHSSRKSLWLGGVELTPNN